MPSNFHIALVFVTYNEHARGVLRGIGSYVEHRANWRLHNSPLGVMSDSVFRSAIKADGIIAGAYTEEIAALLVNSRTPAVAVHYRGEVPVPSVNNDNQQIAQLAADHFIAQGFTRFAFFGVRGRGFSEARARRFREVLETRGFSCENYASERFEFSWHSHDPELVRWLQRLPKPIAIFAANDVMGQQLLYNALQAGVRVPDEAAVLGVDNDELLCRLTSPPMSSIDPASERIGFEAAAMLDKMLKGEPLENREVLVDASRLIVRQSSDVLAVNHPEVSQAVRFIRQNVSRNLTVDDVMQEIPISRRTLELAFRKLLGRSIHEEIAENRIRRAKQLLIDTDMRIDQIADNCGFSQRTHFNATFRKSTRYTPASFRREFRKPR